METEDRVFELYGQFRNSIKNKFKEYDEKEEEISKKYRELHEKFREATDKQCLDLILNLAKSDKNKDSDLYEKNYSLLDDCYEHYDFGLKKQMEGITKKIESVDNILYKCNVNCIKDQEIKDDREIKKCYEVCFDVSFAETSSIQDNLLVKIQDNYLKLNNHI